VLPDGGVVGVPTRDVFSVQELARLRSFGEITRAELIRYFTLTLADEAFLRKFHGPRNVLGASVQLCTLPWLGFVPDEVNAAPAAVVDRLADRLGILAGELAGYGQREQTRTEHLRQILAYAGWRGIDAAGWKELDEFLFARAMEHDSPTLPFQLACPRANRPAASSRLCAGRPARAGPASRGSASATATRPPPGDGG